MKILRKMFFREFLGIFIASLATISVIFLLVDFFDRVQRFVGEGGAPVKLLGTYLLYKLPQILYDIAPLNIPLATLITLGMFNRRSELVAIRAAGIPIRAVLRPIFLFAVLVAVILAAANENVLPQSNMRQERIHEEIKRYKKSRKEAIRGKRVKKGPVKYVSGWYRGAKGIYFLKGYRIDERRIRNFIILEMGADFRVLRRIEAEKAYWQNNKWVGHNVFVRDFLENGEVRVARFEKTDIDIPETEAELEIMEKESKEMGFFELALYIARLESTGSDMRPFRVDMWAKLTYPISGIILLALVVPLGLKSGRGAGVASGIVYSLVICLAYYEFNAWVLSLGRGGALQYPLAAALTAPILFGVAALPMYFRSN